MEWTAWLGTAAALLVTWYLYVRYKYTHWSRRGVKHPEPTFPIGNMGGMFTGKKNFSSAITELAHQYREVGYCGMYQWARPVFMVWDPEMVKQIVCKDFSSFHDRGIPTYEKDPLSMHLFNLSGTKWRNLRNKLSPTFTSGKLKLMLPLMRDIGEELVAVMEASAKKDPDREVDVSAIMSRYATDVIGSVGFGLQVNCLHDEKTEFLQMTKKLLSTSPAQMIKFALESLHPKLGGLVPFKMVFSDVHNFFINMMRDTVEHREKNNIERNDFVQLMMALRNADLSQMDPDNHIELTPGVMAAQGFIFFIAGLDNISNTIAFALTKLAEDQALQEKVAKEVADVLQQHDGELSYEALKKMDLVHRTVLEALRLWSPIGVLIRKCNATTQIGNVEIVKDTIIFIIGTMTNTDENIFPDPMRFDPDRHTAEAKALRHPYAFLPFGEGPRNCIAERFAMLEMKLALATLMKNFKFSLGPGFEKSTELDPKSFFPRPKHGVRLAVTPRA